MSGTDASLASPGLEPLSPLASGLAAVGTAIGEFLLRRASTGAHHALTPVAAAAIYAATFLGGLTVTGSLVAFAKLQAACGVLVAQYTRSADYKCSAAHVIQVA